MLYIWHFQRDFKWTNTSTRCAHLIPINHHFLNTGWAMQYLERENLIESTLLVWEYSLEQYLPKKRARLTSPPHSTFPPGQYSTLSAFVVQISFIFFVVCVLISSTPSLVQMISRWFKKFGLSYSSVVHTFLNYLGIRHIIHIMHRSIEWQGCLYINHNC